jgi:hypothetical protein
LRFVAFQATATKRAFAADLEDALAVQIGGRTGGAEQAVTRAAFEWRSAVAWA